MEVSGLTYERQVIGGAEYALQWRLIQVHRTALPWLLLWPRDSCLPQRTAFLGAGWQSRAYQSVVRALLQGCL